MIKALGLQSVIQGGIVAALGIAFVSTPVRSQQQRPSLGGTHSSPLRFGRPCEGDAIGDIGRGRRQPGPVWHLHRGRRRPVIRSGRGRLYITELERPQAWPGTTDPQRRRRCHDGALRQPARRTADQDRVETSGHRKLMISGCTGHGGAMTTIRAGLLSPVSASESCGIPKFRDNRAAIGFPGAPLSRNLVAKLCCFDAHLRHAHRLCPRQHLWIDARHAA